MISGILDVSLIKNEGFQVAIIDYLMPVKNGMQLSTEIREDPELASFPIVLLTSKEMMQEETKKIMMLNLDYMRKPFVPQIISGKLKEVVARQVGS